MREYEEHLTDAVSQLANDIIDDAEAVLAHFMDEAKADMAVRGVALPSATD
jgi:hypothetical protein